MKTFVLTFISILALTTTLAQGDDLQNQYNQYKRHYNNKEYQEALSYAQMVLATCEEKYGKEHEKYGDYLYNLGKVYLALGEFENALFYYESALVHTESTLGKNHADYGMRLNNLALLYKKMGDYDKALPLLEAAMANTAEMLGTSHYKYGIRLNNMASLYKAMGNFDLALSYYEEALLNTKNALGTEHAKYGLRLSNLASLHKEMGNYDEALPLYKEALLNTKNDLEYLSRLSSLADLHEEMGEYEKALELLTEALIITENIVGVDHPDYADRLNALAGLFKAMGHFEEALSLYKEALLITKNTLGAEHLKYSSRLNNLALLYKEIGNYEKALPLAEEALDIIAYSLGKEHSKYGSRLSSVASLHKEMGNYEKAIPLYKEALENTALALGTEHPDYAIRLKYLATCYEDLGNYEEALPLYQKALLITENSLGKDHPDYGVRLNNLAILYKKMNEPRKALSFYKHALLNTKKTLGEEHITYSTRLNNLANLYIEMEDYNKAFFLLLEARKITKNTLGTENFQYSIRLNNLANLYLIMDEVKAISLYEEALAITEKVRGKDHVAYELRLSNLAGSYRAFGDDDKAYPLYREAKESTIKNMGKMMGFLSEDAMKKYMKSIEYKFKIYHSFYTDYYTENPSVAEDAYDIELATKGLILNAGIQMRQIIANSNDSLTLDLFDQWHATKRKLADEYSKDEAENEVITNLELNANRLESQLVELSNSFKQITSFGKYKWKDIQQALNPNEVAVEFASFRYHNGVSWTQSKMYTALVLRKDADKPFLIELFKEEDLNKLISHTTNNHTQFISDLYRGAEVIDQASITYGSQLYSLVWSPLEEYLNPGEHVYFAPSGLLHQIAFSAIPVDQNTSLSDKYHLTQLSTTAKLLNDNLKEERLPHNLCLYGGIEYDATAEEMLANKNEIQDDLVAMRSLPHDISRGGQWDFLSGTLKEVQRIDSIAHEKQLNSSLYTGLQATEESYQSLSGTNSPDVLHIATHGFFFPDPEQIEIEDLNEIDNQAYRLSDNPLNRAGLILSGGNRAWQGQTPPEGVADGILTAYEASNVTLNNTQLVVLSACETGLGEIQGSEGVFGLQRSFKAAGAEYLIMSLWKVPDAETAEFMENFYINWFTGLSIEEAFRETQLYMKSKYIDDPYKWAAFILLR